MDLPLELLESPSGELSLRYRRPRAQDRPDLSYVITHSGDMENWEEFVPPLEASQAIEDVFGMVTLDFDDVRLQPNSAMGYLRLEVRID